MYLANIILPYLSIQFVEKYESNQYFIKSYLELINNDVFLGWARTVKLDYTKNINNFL